jgi:hypothetical protein
MSKRKIIQNINPNDQLFSVESNVNLKNHLVKGVKISPLTIVCELRKIAKDQDTWTHKQTGGRFCASGWIAALKCFNEVMKKIFNLEEDILVVEGEDTKWELTLKNKNIIPLITSRWNLETLFGENKKKHKATDVDMRPCESPERSPSPPPSPIKEGKQEIVTTTTTQTMVVEPRDSIDRVLTAPEFTTKYICSMDELDTTHKGPTVLCSIFQAFGVRY